MAQPAAVVLVAPAVTRTHLRLLAAVLGYGAIAMAGQLTDHPITLTLATAVPVTLGLIMIDRWLGVR